ncbi:hypothetical protein EDB89DRAFT_570875 [Lactarius sanguifluus]|nr:hypothetical protein EDB89DRAFT_570875 [Lactarius sanguifluus]
MRSDVARPLAYFLSFMPPWRSRRTRPCVCSELLVISQLAALTSDASQSFNEIFNGFEERTGKKLDRHDRSLDSLRTKLVENPQDFDAYLHLNSATDGLKQ